MAAVVEDAPLTANHAPSQPVQAAEPGQPLQRVGLLFCMLTESLLSAVCMM